MSNEPKSTINVRSALLTIGFLVAVWAPPLFFIRPEPPCKEERAAALRAGQGAGDAE
jgi:hypothetical protein